MNIMGSTAHNNRGDSNLSDRLGDDNADISNTDDSGYNGECHGSHNGQFPHQRRRSGLFGAILPQWTLTDALKAAIIGIGFGSFAFLAIAAVNPDWIPVTRMSVLSLFVLSAAISELSYIFQFDEMLPAAAMYAIHCVLTFACVIVWILVNGWKHVLIGQFPLFFGIFVGIYVMVWLVNIVYAKLAARSMNRSLHHRE